MYIKRQYKYDDKFIEEIKQLYLKNGASSVVNRKDIENAFSRFETVGRGEYGNFTTSMYEDNILLYGYDGKLVEKNIIESIKGVDKGKYDSGVFQYIYDKEFVESADKLGLIKVVDGTTPGASSLNIPGSKTWAGKNIEYSETELLMPSIDVSKYDSIDVLSDIDLKGCFEIKNPTVICKNGSLIEIKGTFYIKKIGE